MPVDQTGDAVQHRPPLQVAAAAQMFQGTLNPDAIAAFAPVVAGWDCEELAFPCSGKFTVPRSLAPLGRRMHGNDVTLYSCALGWYFSGHDVRVSVRPGMGLEWMEPYLETTEGRTAAVLVWSEFAEAWVRRAGNAYHRRIAAGALLQFGTMHAKALEGLRGSKWHLASFWAGDCVAFLGMVASDAGIISFPPVYAGGYERMWKHLDACFAWDAPEYPTFDENRAGAFWEEVGRRRHWVVVAQGPITHEAIAGKLLGVVKTTNRAPEFWLYASDVGVKRQVGPCQKTAPLLWPKLGPDEALPGALELRPLGAPEFASLRSQFLDPKIAPSGAQAVFALLAGGVLVGAVAFQRSTFQLAGVDEPSVYLLSDFPVRPTRYPRLSKLVAAAALSRECQLLLERVYGRRLRSVVTTAFTDRPVSMKYRGVLKLLSRTEAAPDDPSGHRYKLNYGAALGQLTLAETLVVWERKHGREGQD